MTLRWCLLFIALGYVAAALLAYTFQLPVG